eukprot:12896563-Alexandrium_andersonii.AAC.2
MDPLVSRNAAEDALLQIGLEVVEGSDVVAVTPWAPTSGPGEAANVRIPGLEPLSQGVGRPEPQVLPLAGNRQDSVHFDPSRFQNRQQQGLAVRGQGEPEQGH